MGPMILKIVLFIIWTLITSSCGARFGADKERTTLLDQWKARRAAGECDCGAGCKCRRPIFGAEEAEGKPLTKQEHPPTNDEPGHVPSLRLAAMHETAPKTWKPLPVARKAADVVPSDATRRATGSVQEPQTMTYRRRGILFRRRG